MNLSNSYRIFVEKKSVFQTEAHSLKAELNQNLHLTIKTLRLIQVYDIFNISEPLLQKAKKTVFSEIVTDVISDQIDTADFHCIAIEFLPGQFDQRADSAQQCLSLIDPQTEAIVRSARLILIDTNVDFDAIQHIKKYCINEIESREKDMSTLCLSEETEIIDVAIIKNFRNFSKEKLTAFHQQSGLAMSCEDLAFIQNYFKQEQRDPTETEIRVLDTYWSDHCRHTTFETAINKVTFQPSISKKLLQEAFKKYQELRQKVHQDNMKPMTLMDMATICGKYERVMGNLDDLEVSDEVNACSIRINVDVDGKEEPWLLMFKNETHNHPTEIEPFGGASTCIGGAIRDPLSGRSYVYQAMRVTGAGDITEPIENTIEGKLPQCVISKKAAAGYSSYGNQIGLATTHVREIYHKGYQAKRMEVGVVVGAVPESAVRREKPQPGDVVMMLGGKTGRDGIGGATGSSKVHTTNSLEHCAPEVQKGNAPEERKIQRLFRNPDVTKLIKKSNDFGAGGVCVAIGELADGLQINLDAIPVKYQGLNGTELAISESQERMSVVISPESVNDFFKYCWQENIEATIVASVIEKRQLIMKWRGKTIVDISRDFLDTNGVRPSVNVDVSTCHSIAFTSPIMRGNIESRILSHLSGLNVASQKGLIEMFDSTIGASTVLMPFGGKYQLSETQASVQKIPVRIGKTDTASILTFGYNPYIASRSPFHGAIYAIIESMAKVVAVGGNYRKIRFSFQEYFEKLEKDPEKWSRPFAALLGAIHMQQAFQIPAIGGKDSMSGSFGELHVPPTLISFAIATEKASKIISSEFKTQGNYIYFIRHNIEKNYMPNIEQLKNHFEVIYKEIQDGNIISAFTLQFGGLIEALFKMSLGNNLGVEIQTRDSLFDYGYGSFVLETTYPLRYDGAILIGKVGKENGEFRINGTAISKQRCIQAWKKTFASIYSESVPKKNILEKNIQNPSFRSLDFQPITPPYHPKKHANVYVLIPVFPGTNCDYDTARAFEEAGAIAHIFVFRNQNAQAINESIAELAHLISQSQILALCGGFSAGDEPDGSGKFIANVLNNDIIKEAIEQFLFNDYLIIGICNGFQALIKSGLLPFGKIGKLDASSPTLYRNDINRHISHIAKTVVSSTNSPWLSSFHVGEQHRVAVSHGEGKFMIKDKPMAEQLFAYDQVAFQYCDFEGVASMNPEDNPNGSHYAIEGIISPCGKILGKMGHSERKGDNLYKNIEGNKTEDIFANAVNYLKWSDKKQHEFDSL